MSDARACVCVQGRACCGCSAGVLKEVAKTDANGGASVLTWAGGGGASKGAAREI